MGQYDSVWLKTAKIAPFWGYFNYKRLRPLDYFLIYSWCPPTLWIRERFEFSDWPRNFQSKWRRLEWTPSFDFVPGLFMSVGGYLPYSWSRPPFSDSWASCSGKVVKRSGVLFLTDDSHTLVFLCLVPLDNIDGLWHRKCKPVVMY